MDTSAPPEFPSNLKIPVDLFVSKKHHGLRFADSSGDLVFSVDRQSYESTQRRRKQVLLDASGNPLITLYRDHNGSWQGFRGGDTEEYLIFRVERTLNPLCRTEFDVVLVGENSEDLKSDFKMKGCPFQRSCTIYRGNSIAAQDIHQL